jgi:UDP-N-acetylglucosamine 2-epimerase (hydrolysing)
VASESARNRLIQLGEQPNTIFTIGSPDVDIMLSSKLPSIEEVKTRYEITFNQYSIAILHPVTTEELQQKEHARIWVDALIASNLNFIVVYPNNDKGANYIFEELKRVSDHTKFKVFPSLRFEYFLTMLKHARFITGNSSAGIHEAPIFGVPTVNIGSRQDNRFSYCSIHNVDFDAELILAAHNKALQNQRYQPTDHYGDGTSAVKFMSALQGDIWHVSSQKSFRDVPNTG